MEILRRGLVRGMAKKENKVYKAILTEFVDYKAKGDYNKSKES